MRYSRYSQVYVVQQSRTLVSNGALEVLMTALRVGMDICLGSSLNISDL